MRTTQIAYTSGNGGFARANAAMSAFRSPAGLAAPAMWLPFSNDHVVCDNHKTGTTARRLGEASP